MRPEITIIYNAPTSSDLEMGKESKAVLGVLDCVSAVSTALLDGGYKISRIPLAPPMENVKAKLATLKTDLVFNLFEGFFENPQSEAEVAFFMEERGLRFTGCRGKVLLLALDKARSKELLAANGIGVPRFQVLSLDTVQDFNLPFPCIVKPRCADASHGITKDSVVRDIESLKRQIKKISTMFNGEAMAEEYLDGREFNITVFGNENLTTLPVSEIVYSLPAELPKILTFEAKWVPRSGYFKGTGVECPARIDESLRKAIAEVAISAFHIFDCTGYARVDLRLDSSGGIRVLEVNPNPDISPDTGAARQARAMGLSYGQFIENIVMLSIDEVPV
jgi:D-alanine-D-alanine ligase